MKSKSLFYLILLTLITLLALAAHAQSFSVIHSFGMPNGNPAAGVTIQGNALYGTTQEYGSVYQLTHNGSDWLFSFIAALPYDLPSARVVFGPDGHLYGTTWDGGPYYFGNVFKLTPPVGVCKTVACYWTVNDLHDFGSGTDGGGPGYGDLIWDQQGNMYGTTNKGGTYNRGTVYELTPSGNGYTESVLYSFSGPDGANPYAGLVRDNKGNLFGTTYFGGSHGAGVVFELTYVPGVGWTEHLLYSLGNGTDGELPYGGVILDSAGNLYGTTQDGCLGGGNGGGTVFELSPSGDTWAFKVLYCSNGAIYTTLSMDGAGNLYGTTTSGGIYDQGSVFKLSNTENGWLYTSLYDFTGHSDGKNPYGNVAIDTDGTLYGTTYYGGDQECWYAQQCGVVWMIKP